MAERIAHEIKMLEALIAYAGLGKKIELRGRPVREIIRLERDGQEFDTVVLSMAYSGMVDDDHFELTKNYSFADDAPQYALECLLIANNRLQMDHERLRDAGIEADLEFFNFRNCFMPSPEVLSVKSPALRLQDFIQLSRAGVPVKVDIFLSRPAIVSEIEGGSKKGFGCMAGFSFITGTEQTTLEKLYGLGGYDDAKGEEKDVVEVANKRLERDFERLRRAGIQVEKQSFEPIWERVFDR